MSFDALSLSRRETCVSRGISMRSNPISRSDGSHPKVEQNVSLSGSTRLMTTVGTCRAQH